MTEASSDDLLANLYGFYTARARGSPHSQVFDEGSLLLIDSGLPTPELNIAFLTGPVEEPAAVVRRALEVFTPPRGWRFESGMDEVARFSPVLAAAGLHPSEVRPALLLRPADLVTAPTPAGFAVEIVESPADRRRFYETLVRGMTGQGLSPTFPPPEQLRLEGGHSLLGTLDGVPVATAQIFVHRGVVGLYAVATIASVRRRGLGRAISTYAAQEGFRRGARRAFLQSTPMALAVYGSIGFRPAFEHQVWRPSTTVGWTHTATGVADQPDATR